MIVVDANVLIGLYDSQDANHHAAERLLLAHAGDNLSMSALTLTEFLIRPTAVGKLAQAESLITALGIHVSPLSAADAPRIAEIRAATRLKLPDAVVLWLAQSSSAALMTLDDRLAKEATHMGIDCTDPEGHPFCLCQV